VGFLRIQHQLKELALMNVENLFQPIGITGRHRFQLTKLSLIDLPNAHTNNLIAFMNQHAATLEDFEISSGFDVEVYECAMTKLDKVTRMLIDFGNVSTTSEFIYTRCPNRNLKDLTLIGNVHKLQMMSLICRFPAMETLRMNVQQNHVFDFEPVVIQASKVWKNLKFLTKPKISNRFIKCGTFPQLKHLEADQLEWLTVGNWLKFAHRNPNIEYLSLKMIDCENFYPSELPKLEVLKIGHGIVLTERKLETIIVSCPKLRDLFVTRECIELKKQRKGKKIGNLNLMVYNFTDCIFPSLYKTMWTDEFKPRKRPTSLPEFPEDMPMADFDHRPAYQMTPEYFEYESYLRQMRREAVRENSEHVAAIPPPIYYVPAAAYQDAQPVLYQPILQPNYVVVPQQQFYEVPVDAIYQQPTHLYYNMNPASPQQNVQPLLYTNPEFFDPDNEPNL
jgi:hypothetical protein